MQNASIADELLYPYDFTFRISTIHNDFRATDATGLTKAYVKQKLFKLKEHVEVFSDESQANLMYNIHANKWLDFDTTYSFVKPDGTTIGWVARKGWRSLWKASYELYDENNNQNFVIQEANPWVKVADALLSEIPLLGIFTGYLFNPSYTIKRPDGTLMALFKKQPSFFSRKFQLTKEARFANDEAERVLLGVMMMALLERRRG